MRFIVSKVVHRSNRGSGAELLEPESGARFWGKFYSEDCDPVGLSSLFDKLRQIQHGLLAAPIAFGEGLADLPPFPVCAVFPFLEARPLDSAWVEAAQEQREEWIKDTLRAMHLLHVHEMVHGDIAPSNLLIASSRSVRLIDADWHYQRYKKANRRSGHADMMSPEVLNGEEVDGRSDLYSFGLVLWELMAGRRGGRPDIQRRLSADIHPVGLPQSSPWHAWIGKSLRRHPNHRWQDAFEAFRFAPFLHLTDFYDKGLLAARYRLLRREDETALQALLRLGGLVPSPGGFIESWLSKQDNAGICKAWEKWLGNDRWLRLANEGGTLTERFLLSLHEEIGAGSAGAVFKDSLPEAVRPLDSAYEAGQHEEAIEIGRCMATDGKSPRKVRAIALNYVGLSLWATNRPGEACKVFEEAAFLFEKLDESHWGLKAINNLGMVCEAIGKSDEARAHYLNALAKARSLASDDQTATLLFNLAGNSQRRGKTGEAIAFLEEARETFGRGVGGDHVARIVFNLSLLWDRCGEFERSLALLGQSIERTEFDLKCRQLLKFRRVHSLLEADRPEEANGLLAEALSGATVALAPPHHRLAEQLKARIACLRGAPWPEESAACEPGELRPIPDDLVEEEFWRAAGLCLQGDPSGARKIVSEISPDRISPASLLQLRLLVLLTRLEMMAGESKTGFHLRAIESFLAKWLDETPQSMRRSLTAHPLYREAASLLRNADVARKGREGHASMIIKAMSRAVQNPSMETVASRSLEAFMDVTGAERGFLVSTEGGSLEILASFNINREAVGAPESAISHSLLQKAITTGGAVLESNAQADPHARESVYDLHLLSVLVIPLGFDGRIVGACYLDHRSREGVFSEIPVDLLLPMGAIAASGIVSLRLLKDLHTRNSELLESNRKLTEMQRQLADRVSQESQRNSRLAADLEAKNRVLAALDPWEGLEFRNLEMRRIVQYATKIAPTSLPVLITGESGTGKEVMARSIHFHSDRAGGPFISINCGALPEGLVESELFGHVKGAFTGAERDQEGAFVAADGGTLFLDEIGSMPMAGQVKLLRALQDSLIRPVGGTAARPVSVRIIAATNADLASAMASNRFREDLYYRINAFRIDMPPLRHRIEDIPLLIEFLLENRRHPVGLQSLFDGARMQKWMVYPWPGNIRELVNHVEHYCVTGSDPLLDDGCSALSPRLRTTGGYPFRDALRTDIPSNLRQFMRRIEQEILEEALARSEGNAAEAARLLGMNKTDVYYRLKRLRQSED